MTREDIERRAELYSALAEGKTIQDWTNDTWKDKEYTSFGELSQSPIKPQPKYRPFKSQEECWQEMHKHPDFGWVINEGVYMIVQSIYNDEIYTAELLDNIDYKYAVENLIFTDGTPFGMKEE